MFYLPMVGTDADYILQGTSQYCNYHSWLTVSASPQKERVSSAVLRQLFGLNWSSFQSRGIWPEAVPNTAERTRSTFRIGGSGWPFLTNGKRRVRGAHRGHKFISL